MLFTGRPFTAKEMYDANFINSVVERGKLDAETMKYASACSKSRPTDTVAVQKTFIELYKQHRGEYMGSLLTGMVARSEERRVGKESVSRVRYRWSAYH